MMVDNSVPWKEHEAALERISALTAALIAAHEVAVTKAFERDRSDQPDGKMQGATAAVIANDILAILHANGISRAADEKNTDGK